MAKIEIYKKETVLDKVKRKAGEAKDWCVDRGQKLYAMCKDNPALAVEVAAGVFTILGSGITLAAKAIDGHNADREVWDPELGKHVRIKRPLTPKEDAEYNDRLKEAKSSGTGETRYDILRDMGLTK